MTEKNRTTSPPSQEDLFWLDSFRQEYIKESERYDNFAKELFKLELAIPGFYAIGLKLSGGTLSLDDTGWVLTMLAFVCWLPALGLALWGLFPKKYQVPDKVPKGFNSFFGEVSATKRNA